MRWRGAEEYAVMAAPTSRNRKSVEEPRRKKSRGQNSVSTAMPADAMAVHAATRRVPASGRRRCLCPAITNGTGISVPEGSMHSPRTTRAKSSTSAAGVGPGAGRKRGQAS